MEYIENYFKSKTKDITFIELKNDTVLNENKLLLKGDTPLPIIVDDLIREIKKGSFKEEVNLGNIVEGIIYLLGVDKKFPNLENYKEILNSYDANIKNYIFYKGLKAMEEGSVDNGAIYFRAMLTLEPDNINGLFNYSLALEEIAKRYISKEKVEKGNRFLIHSTNVLESILDIDKNYSLAYYKLGYHYKYFGQYLKAKLIWTKFLSMDKDDLRLQEVRDELELIEDDAIVESGLSYLSYNEFGKALDLFMKLMPKYKDNWNANYLLGVSYKGLEEYEKAIEYLNKAMELNKEEPDIYNELGILYFSLGEIVEAVRIFSGGIENCNDDYKLYFNRGLGYVQLGQYELALQDIDIACELNPDDENILIRKQELEELLRSI